MQYIQNIFSNNHKLILIATLLVSTFTLQFYIPFTLRIFARFEVLIQNSVNLNIRISFYRRFKN